MFKMFKNKGLTYKVISIFILISLLQGVLIAFVTWTPFQERIKQHIFSENQEMASRIANDIERMFTEKINILSIMAESDALKSMDEKRQQMALASIANNMTEVQLAVLASAKGQQIARWDLLPHDASIQYVDRPYFKQVMSTGQLAISDVLRARSTNKLGVVVAVPVKSDQNEIIAVLIINIELQKLIETIMDTRIGNGAQAYVVNNKEEIVISPNEGLMEKPIPTDGIAPIESVISGQSGSLEYYEGRSRILASYVPVPSPHWGVVVKQSYVNAMDGISTIRKNAIVLLILLVFLSAGVGSIMALMIVKPIQKITEGSRRLADGDMSVRLTTGPSGELGQLIDSFNKMAARLSSRQEELEEMVAQRTYELNRLNEELEHIATIDSLTGIANRRTLDTVLQKEWQRAMRNQSPLSILMIDVDFFKAYNDCFGHQVGDVALQTLAKAMEKTLFHSTDLPARYGGEEFMMVLPGANLEGALLVAERLQANLIACNIAHPTSTISDRLTISIGVASCVPEMNSTLASFVIAADQALYKAKQNGRNQVCQSNI